jgi:hypothetical protein
MRKVVVVVSLLAAGLVPLMGPVPAEAGGGSVITVETTTDGFTNSPMTLRQAVTLAATDGGTTTIQLPPGSYQLTICAASGFEDENVNANGDLDQLTVGDTIAFVPQPATSGTITIRQTCAGERVVHSAGVVILRVDLTGGTPVGSGGGISTSATVLAEDAEIYGNTTANSGGGIFAAGQVQLERTEMHDNEAGSDGGSIRAGGFVGLTDSQVTGSFADSRGGGIWALGDGDVNLIRSTVGRNRAETGGGGIYLDGSSVVLEDSTVAQNTTGVSGVGGIFATDQVVASQSTIAGNETADGSVANIEADTYSASETVVADPVAGPNCAVTNSPSDGYNVEEGDDSCGQDDPMTDLVNTGDPGLQRLFFNGGPTETLYLAKTSFLREGAPTTSNGCSNGGTDQRGAERPQGALCDVGAVEVLPCGQAFGDVAASHPFCWEIGWMSDAGISTGFGIMPRQYRPNQVVTRQSMSAFLYRLAGSPEFADPPTATFSDVPTTSTFFTEIEWMNAAGITTGFPGGLFKPNDAVKRQSMSAFMFRMVDPSFSDPPTATFSDVAAGSTFFTEIEWMAEEGITTGFPGGLFKPDQDVTRQSMSAFMVRLAPFLSGGVQF